MFSGASGYILCLKEDFGIAPVELQLAGCITFVPDDGGQIEIIDRDIRLASRDAKDATAARVERVMGLAFQGDDE